jgi:lipid-A-disaccharide synthase
MADQNKSPWIFFAVAEISADIHAAFLARSILHKLPTARLFGCGGIEMAKAGIEIDVETAELGYIKIRESWVTPSNIKRAHHRLHHLVCERRPDLAILVDSERFNGTLIKFLAKQGIPTVYYLSPQVAFWAPWRARKYARLSNLIIPAFSSELNLFKRAGARVKWVGHPLLDVLNPCLTDSSPKAAPHPSNSDPILIGLMPGSRLQEINLFTPIILQSVAMMSAAQPGLSFVLPIASKHLAERITRMIEEDGLNDLITVVDTEQHLWIKRCNLLLASTGTVTLEAAILGTPMISFYKLNPITYIVARALVRTRFIALPNIVLNRKIVPELIQSQFNPKNLAQTALSLINDPGRYGKMVADLQEVRNALGEKGAIDRAADLIVTELRVGK